MISKSHVSVKVPAQHSAKVHNEVGSGSRPTASKHKIMTSAPAHPHKLGRAPAGALK